MIKKVTKEDAQKDTQKDSRIIRGHHVTEKASRLSPENQYVFKVDLKADKLAIKKAIEKQFNVKIKAVNTLIRGGKTRRFGKTTGKKSDLKMAYVTLENGYSINLDSSTAKG
jgi:large subunit ribosomal protein L23